MAREKSPGLDLALCRQVAEQCAAIKLRRAARLVNQQYDRMRRPAGLTGPQFSLLVALALAGSPTVTQLARLLELDQTTLSRTVRPLEKGALLKFGQGPDRRTRTVSLTERGVARLSAALRLWRESQTQLLARFGAARWADLSDHLKALHGLYEEP